MCSRQSSAEGRASRPTTLRYLRSGLERVRWVTRHAAAVVTRRHGAMSSDEQVDGAGEEAGSEEEMGSGQPCAPKATPEDSTIGSWCGSPDSSEPVQQPYLDLLKSTNCESCTASNNTYAIQYLPLQSSEARPQWCSLDSSADESSPLHRPRAPANKSSDSLSGATRSQQRSTSTESPVTQEVSAELCSDSSRAASTVALVAPRFGSEPLSVGWTELSPFRNVAKPHSLSLSNPDELGVVHGLSPSSPTYQQTHTKFSHTGSHALDLFVSPDEPFPPCGELWPMDALYMLPTVDAPTPGTATQASLDFYSSCGSNISLPASGTTSETSIHHQPSPPRSILSNTTPKRQVGTKSVHITLPQPEQESWHCEQRHSGSADCGKRSKHKVARTDGFHNHNQNNHDESMGNSQQTSPPQQIRSDGSNMCTDM